jgi:hypothetical protein
MSTSHRGGRTSPCDHSPLHQNVRACRRRLPTDIVACYRLPMPEDKSDTEMCPVEIVTRPGSRTQCLSTALRHTMAAPVCRQRPVASERAEHTQRERHNPGDNRQPRANSARTRLQQQTTSGSKRQPVQHCSQGPRPVHEDATVQPAENSGVGLEDAGCGRFRPPDKAVESTGGDEDARRYWETCQDEPIRQRAPPASSADADAGLPPAHGVDSNECRRDYHELRHDGKKPPRHTQPSR